MIKRLVLVAALLAPYVVRAQATFLPGIVTKPDSGEAFGTFTPDGRTFIYTKHQGNFAKHRIMMTRLDSGRWSPPVTLPFSGQYNDREPKLSPDGRRLYFSSNRPRSAGEAERGRDLDLWMVDRRADGSWATPVRLQGVNTDAPEFCPVVTANGTLYFILRSPQVKGVMRSRPIDLASGRFSAPEQLPPEVSDTFTTNVYVTPDESLMIVSKDGAPDGLGGDDLYASRRVNGAWQPMRHLEAPINSKEYEYGPTVTPNGTRLVFTSQRSGNGDIYGVSIGELEREEVRRAALDYLEGFYEGDTAKLVRAFRTEMFKYGFHRDSTGRYEGSRMTFDEAMAYAKRVRASNRPVNPNWPKQVEIYEVLDQTASAKVTAWWGTDYLLLGKYNGRWQIAHVMWQGPLMR
jgi:hypothetical protein